MSDTTNTVSIFTLVKGNPTLITLLEGVPESFEDGGRTEEGYHYECEEYTLENGEITCNVMTDSRDCDGPLKTYNTYWFSVKNGKYRTNKDGLKFPIWENTSSSQRDYYAESIGY